MIRTILINYRNFVLTLFRRTNEERMHVLIFMGFSLVMTLGTWLVVFSRYVWDVFLAYRGLWPEAEEGFRNIKNPNVHIGIALAVIAASVLYLSVRGVPWPDPPRKRLGWLYLLLLGWGLIFGGIFFTELGLPVMGAIGYLVFFAFFAKSRAKV